VIANQIYNHCDWDGKKAQESERGREGEGETQNLKATSNPLIEGKIYIRKP